MMDTINRDIGRLEANVSNLKLELADVKAEVHEIKAALARIEAQMSEARGGWKAIMIIGGVSATLTGVVIKAAELLWRQ